MSGLTLMLAMLSGSAFTLGGYFLGETCDTRRTGDLIRCVLFFAAGWMLLAAVDVLGGAS